MVDLMAGLATVSKAYELAKDAKATADRFKNVEMQGQLVDLMSALVDVKAEAVVKATRIAELEEQLALTKAMTFDGVLCWQGEGDNREGPFCQRCFDDAKKAVRLQRGGDCGFPWNCKVCDSDYGDYVAPPSYFPDGSII